MSSKPWKAHEKAVANFFRTHPNQDHLTKASRRPGSDSLGSDVIVKLADWLNSLGQKKPKEPWQTLIVECKYRALTNAESFWLRRFWAFYDKVPKSVNKALRKPLMYMASGWCFCRLTDFYSIYRHLLASSATGKEFPKWIEQHWAHFWMEPLTEPDPGYFTEWTDEMSDEKGKVDTKVHGPTLGVICLGSSLKRQGEGGGRVVALNRKVCWK